MYGEFEWFDDNFVVIDVRTHSKIKCESAKAFRQARMSLQPQNWDWNRRRQDLYPHQSHVRTKQGTTDMLDKCYDTDIFTEPMFFFEMIQYKIPYYDCSQT